MRIAKCLMHFIAYNWFSQASCFVSRFSFLSIYQVNQQNRLKMDAGLRFLLHPILASRICIVLNSIEHENICKLNQAKRQIKTFNSIKLVLIMMKSFCITNSLIRSLLYLYIPPVEHLQHTNKTIQQFYALYRTDFKFIRTENF